MADTDSTPIKCGFCLLQDAAMKDPRTMRCGHTHCGSCLSALWNSMGKIICAHDKCRYTSLSDLNGQTHSTSKRHDIWCQKCDFQKRASMFCNKCQNSYCVECKKKHGEVHPDHEEMSTYEYKFKAKSLEERKCAKPDHADIELSRGCPYCWSTFCALCARGDIKAKELCKKTGEGHTLTDLEDLVKQLEKDVKGMQEKMHEKEKELAMLHDGMSNSIREHEAQTEKLINQLNTARDEQLAAINENYDQLVADFKDRRERSLKKLKEFEETEVTNHWLDLIIGRQKVEAFLKYSHKVDLVKEHDNKMKEIKDLINREMPVQKIDIVGTTPTGDLCRKPELKLFTKQQEIHLHNPYRPDELVQETRDDNSDDISDDEFEDAVDGGNM